MILIKVLGILCLMCLINDITVGQITMNNLDQDIDNKANAQVVLTTCSLDRLSLKDNFNLNTSVLKIDRFNPKDLPMFCKMEHQMWSSSKMNVRIRLGSLDYVDKLEGKY